MYPGESRGFYTTILDKDREFIRFDSGCMKPVDDFGAAARTVVEEKLKYTARHDVTWRIGDVLVLDNWRILHARGPIVTGAEGRVLVRAEVIPR